MSVCLSVCVCLCVCVSVCLCLRECERARICIDFLSISISIFDESTCLQTDEEDEERTEKEEKVPTNEEISEIIQPDDVEISCVQVPYLRLMLSMWDLERGKNEILQLYKY